MTIFRFSMIALFTASLGACSSERSEADAARIEELEDEVSRLEVEQAKENRHIRAMQPTPWPTQNLGEPSKLELESERLRNEADRSRDESENARLRAENARLERAQADREFQDGIWK